MKENKAKFTKSEQMEKAKKWGTQKKGVSEDEYQK